MSNSKRIKVAIFGLSANPPTGLEGHAGIVKYLVKIEKFDEIWILPVYRHQFSVKNLINFEDRIKMCELNFQKLETIQTKIKILSIEKVVNELHNYSHGTIDTIKYIQENHPEVEVHLIIGEDAYRDICNGKWKQGDKLFEICKVHVIDRLGLPSLPSLSAEEITKQLKFQPFQRHNLSFIENVSSTIVKSFNPYPFWPLPFENPLLIKMLDPSVYEYIKEHHLYTFSSQYLWKYKIFRGIFLGIFIYLICFSRK